MEGYFKKFLNIDSTVCQFATVPNPWMCFLHYAPIANYLNHQQACDKVGLTNKGCEVKFQNICV